MKRFRILIGLVISIILLGFVFREIDLPELVAALSEVDVIWIPVAVFVYFFGIWLRTTRWTLLMQPIKKCSTRSFFPIYVISYMANNILPLRLGDVYRAYIVGKKESVSKGASLVTIGVERIFDGLTMLALLSLALLFYPVEDPLIKKAVTYGAVFFFTAIVICYVAVLNQKWATWFFHKVVVTLMPVKYHVKMNTIVDNLFVGLKSLKGFKTISGVIVFSFITWLVEAVSYMIVLIAFGFSGNFHVSIMTMALVNLMIIIPAAPGYFGPFELACVIVLGNTGYDIFSQEHAVAFALILHVVVQWIPSTFLGLVYMWKEHINFREINWESDKFPENE